VNQKDDDKDNVYNFISEIFVINTLDTEYLLWLQSQTQRNPWAKWQWLRLQRASACVRRSPTSSMSVLQRSALRNCAPRWTCRRFRHQEVRRVTRCAWGLWIYQSMSTLRKRKCNQVLRSQPLLLQGKPIEKRIIILCAKAEFDSISQIYCILFLWYTRRQRKY
jgi:hypothetical protein